MSCSRGSSTARRPSERVVVRSALLAALVVAYRLGFSTLHERIGEPVFLLGLLPCLAAALLLGLRGALVVVVVVTLLDRSSALSIGGSSANRIVGVLALSAKLLLAGGLGWVVDSRRRMAWLNARLREEMRARERGESSLRKSEETYRALVESLGEGVGLFDGEDRVVFANRVLARALGGDRHELVGTPFCDLLTSESRAAMASALAGGSGPRHYEVSLEREPSTLLLITETRLEAEQQPMTLRVVRDLTERVASERRQRNLERELQRSQSLQSLAVLAGGVAHDFNNLLCGVVGNAEVAQRKVPEGAPPVLSHCLREISAFATEAAELSRQMLAYAGRRSMGIRAVDGNAELSKALRLLNSTIESKASLKLELSPGLPLVAADVFQLRQVLTNLVFNALDAMQGTRGVLTLGTQACRLSAGSAAARGMREGRYVKITVRDTGTGISESARERLFEPFFSTKAPGRGMGLAAAAGIARAHRGWLGVESSSANGTAFAFLLPVAADSTPRCEAPARLVSAPTLARTILLIDDEPAVRVVTGRLLSELGHRVVTAESGRQGLELFHQQRGQIDVVVLDLTMPERSGEQVLQELRLLGGNVPVVITSGFHANDASRLLGAPNVVGFLGKPHTLVGLEDVLASVGHGVAAPS